MLSIANNRLPSGVVVAGIWAVGRRIGNGSFGEIYAGTHLETGKEVAIKFVSYSIACFHYLLHDSLPPSLLADSRTFQERCKSKHPQLLYEAKLLRRLQGGEGVAQLYHSGVVEVTFPSTASTSSLYTYSTAGQNENNGAGGGDATHRQGGTGSANINGGPPTNSDHPVVESYNVMVTELLGPTLEDLFSVCDRKLHAHTVLHIMEEMVSSNTDVVSG